MHHVDLDVKMAEYLSTHDDADIIESIWGHDKSKHGKKALGQELVQDKWR